MDTVTKPRRRNDRGARSNVIAGPASELPINSYKAVPDLLAPLALREVRP